MPPVKSLISIVKKKLTGSAKRDMIIGEVLRQKKIITKEQLEHALKVQEEKLIELGQAVAIGLIIVELGYAEEEALVKAVNEHYKISVSSLSDNIKGLVNILRGTFVDRLPAPRFPIWFQLTVTTIFVIVLTTTVFNFVILKRQEEQLYDQTVKIGLVSVNYFDNNAKIPLIEGDVLQLNTIVKNASLVEGLVYAFIIDNHGKVLAHTDLSKVGKPMEKFNHKKKVTKLGDDTYFDHIMPDQKHVLNLTRSIAFKGKQLGHVHVGVSIDFIQDLIIRERASIIMITLLVILLSTIVAAMLGYRYSHPISKLLHATQEISRGNYRYKVDLKRNDELGNLAAAFNQMNEELWKNSLMQESFGKYVGSEILEMIMANPQSTWLKGRRNKATILFADIRGFTSYSDNNQPEHVVEMLNEYFTIATNAILEFGGYIDKFIGDAVLGIFGVPVFQKNHTERAVKAALFLQQKLKEAGENENKMYSSVGIGIDTGIVVSGNIGSQVKMEYTVIGNSVNIASRLNGIAGSGEIIISKTVYEEVIDVIHAETLPAQMIKGKSEPLEIFKIQGLKEKPDAKYKNAV